MTAPMQPLLPQGVDVYLVEENANPSTDYFVLPACAGGGRRLHRCSFGQVPPAEALAGAVVVFVRYVPAEWRRQVEKVRSSLAQLVFFMDDDVFDPAAAAGMPWRYRYKLFTLAARHRGWLQRQGSALWVSTAWLARKYADWTPRVITARPRQADSGACRVFYHGTASHGAEIEWLLPVMRRVLEQDEGIVFEIVGGQGVYRRFRSLPRVTVVHPMKWAAYQAFMQMPGRHIGLAPLLDLPFNRARSCTKFFDITRCGAVGLYSAGSVCADVVRHGVDGLLLPLEQEAWIDAILALAHDEVRRRAMLLQAQAALAAD